MTSDLQKSTPNLALIMQNVHFILNYSQSSKDEKNTHVKVTRRLRKFEQMSRKQGLLLKFENVTNENVAHRTNSCAREVRVTTKFIKFAKVQQDRTRPKTMPKFL